MELQNLAANVRNKRGKGVARRTRGAGQIPAILYGGEGEAVSLSVDGKTFSHMLHGKQGEHAIVQLDIAGEPSLNGPAIVKSVQHHPIRGDILHADFMRIRLDEKIRTLVQVVLTGRPVGVIEGGVLDHQTREVEIECLALDVPETIEVDVSGLKIGDSIHVEQLDAPAGVEIITPPDRAVAAIHAPRVAATAEEEAAEAEEAAAAEEETEDTEKSED